MPRVDFERTERYFHGLNAEKFQPILATNSNGLTNSRQCSVCVTPNGGTLSACRSLWTPDETVLYRSDFSMPSWTYVGSDDDYEAIEEVGFTGLGDDYEIWANSSKYLDGLTIDSNLPWLLWTFLGPLDTASNCTLKDEDITITTNTYVEPSITSGVDEWNVTESLTLSRATFFAHDTSADGEHRVNIDILHVMDWEAVVGGVGEGYLRHRFEVGSRLNWFETNQTQSYWQSTNPHNATITLTSNSTTGSYWRKEPADAPGDYTFVRSIPWSESSTIPSIDVQRREF